MKGHHQAEPSAGIFISPKSAVFYTGLALLLVFEYRLKHSLIFHHCFASHREFSVHRNLP